MATSCAPFPPRLCATAPRPAGRDRRRPARCGCTFLRVPTGALDKSVQSGPRYMHHLRQLTGAGRGRERYRIQATDGRPESSSQSNGPLGPDPFLTFFGPYRIRSWTPEDAEAVARLAEIVQSVPGPGGQTFNPEGPLDDCFHAQREYFDQGGVFLVIERHEDGDTSPEVVGSAAVVLGDELAYFRSGASMSYDRRPISGALRRVCLSSAVPEAEASELLSFVVKTAEGAALYLCKGNPVSLIALGVDRACGAEDMSASGRGLGRRTLERIGYASLGRLSYDSGSVSIEELGRVIDSPEVMKRGTSSREAGNKGSSEFIEVTTNGGIAIGTFTRAFVERHNLLHTAVGCLVMNTRGQVYVHQRSPAKSVHPSMYDMYIGGLVTAGESPLSAARQELIEELGLVAPSDGIAMEPTFVKPFLGSRNRVLVHCYRVVVENDNAISYNDGEIVAGVWMDVEAIEMMRKKEEFVPGGLSMWEEALRRKIAKN